MYLMIPTSPELKSLLYCNFLTRSIFFFVKSYVYQSLYRKAEDGKSSFLSFDGLFGLNGQSLYLNACPFERIICCRTSL